MCSSDLDERWLDLHVFTMQDLADAIAVVQAREPTLKATRADRLVHVMRCLQSRHVLEHVVQRQRPIDSPGVPDLCLWRTDASGRIGGAWFVEVKRRTERPSWRESLSASQKAEVAFLRSLGLKATPVWMTEVAPGDRKSTRLNSSH